MIRRRGKFLRLFIFFIEGKNVYELVQSALIFLEVESVFKSLFVAIFILD